MSLNWFLSAKVRQASQMRAHVRKILESQRDLLSPKAIQSVQASMDHLSQLARTTRDRKTLAAGMDELEKSANEWLKPYPFASWRENVEVFLVAIGLAMGVRTFFLQPFKIPTGSMQPTLYGIMPPLGTGNQPNLEIPNAFVRFVHFWTQGISYAHIVAPAAGQLDGVHPVTRFLLFNLKQEYSFNGEWHTVWFPPDSLFERAGLHVRYSPHGSSRREVMSPRYEAGEDIVRLEVTAGDHLLVDRLTYNFKGPRRGDIVVFKTEGISPLPQDQFYIKRLIGLGGERVQIGNDRHVRIDERRLDKHDRGFGNLYDEAQWGVRAGFMGHVNDRTFPGMSTMFSDENKVLRIRPNHYFVLGDNTTNSQDSRYWGDFPAGNVIGKAFFVYWPCNKRFGWGY